LRGVTQRYRGSARRAKEAPDNSKRNVNKLSGKTGMWLSTRNSSLTLLFFY
jgi:hypothetical protein